MKMKKTLIIGLLLAIILVAECVEKGTEQRVSGEGEQATIGEAQTAEENVLSVSNEISAGEPTSPFRVSMTLSEVPTLNKDVEVTITVTTLEWHEPPIEFPNSSISFKVERYDPAESPSFAMDRLFRGLSTRSDILWNGIIRFNETVTVKHVFRIVGPGYYAVTGGVGVGGGIDNRATFFLNVTEKFAKTSTIPYFLPPPPPGPPGEYRPLDLKLEMAGIPKLNNTVELIATVISNIDENSVNVPFDPKNTTFTIFLPEGFELVSGNLVWNGKLTTTKPILLRATVKAVKTGDWQISLVPLKEKPFAIGCAFNGYMDIRITEKEGWQRFGKGGCLFVRITNETGEVSEVPLPSPSPPPKTTLTPFETIPPPASPPPTTPPSTLPSETKSPPLETASPQFTYYPPITTSPPAPSNASK